MHALRLRSADEATTRAIGAALAALHARPGRGPSPLQGLEDDFQLLAKVLAEQGIGPAAAAAPTVAPATAAEEPAAAADGEQLGLF